MIVDGGFLGAAAADCGSSVISASIFRTVGLLDSHAITFNKEVLLDIYLPLT